MGVWGQSTSPQARSLGDRRLLQLEMFRGSLGDLSHPRGESAGEPDGTPVDASAATLSSPLKPPLKYRRSEARRVPLAWRLLFIAVVLYSVMLLVHTGNSQFWIDVADLGELLAATLAAIACSVRARGVRRRYTALAAAGGGSGQPPRRHAWTLLAAGVGLWAVGQLVWCIYEIVLVQRIPEPSLADPFYVAGTIVLIAGLVAFVHTPAGHLSQLRGAVEALCIACGFLLCTWDIVIGPVISGSRPLGLGDYVNLSYPMLDAVALGAVFFVALRRRHDPPARPDAPRRGNHPVDALRLGSVVHGRSRTRTARCDNDLGRLGRRILVDRLRRVARAQSQSGAEEPSESRFVLALPALPGLGGVLIVVSAWLVEGKVTSSNVLLGIMVVFMILALTLLVIVIYENDALTGDLEQRVRERTAELDKTERYYRALVQNSSDLIVVLDSDLRMRYVSDACESVFGFPSEDLVGRGLESFGSDAFGALTSALERLAGSHGRSAPVSWSLVDPTGRVRRAESTVTNLLADSDVGGFVLNTRDDTDRVALEEQLQDQVFHDPLTGLPNRALLEDRVSRAFVQRSDPRGRSG